MVKRINISASNVLYEDKVKDMIYHQQLNLFTNQQNINQKDEKKALEKEKNLQKATLKIWKSGCIYMENFHFNDGVFVLYCMGKMRKD